MPAHAALAAAGAHTLGVGFSGGGFLIPFFLGVIDMLYNDLRVLNHSAPVAGASTGAIACGAAAGIVTVDVMRAETDALGSFCRARGNCYGILQGAVVDTANNMLPPNAAELAKAHGRVYIAVTHPNPKGAGPARQELVGSWSDKADVVASVAASVYIPMWAGPRVTTEFRGQRVYDGGWAGPGAGFLPCPPGVEYCLRVSSMPPGVHYGSFLIEYIIKGGAAAAKLTASVVGATLATADITGYIKGLVSNYASAGMRVFGLEAAQLQQALGTVLALVSPGEGGADVWPGRFHKLPFSVMQWTVMQAVPADEKVNAQLFEFGRAEALSWAQFAGLPEALARGKA